jgi:hypothetical protein
MVVGLMAIVTQIAADLVVAEEAEQTFALTALV